LLDDAADSCNAYAMDARGSQRANHGGTTTERPCPSAFAVTGDDRRKRFRGTKSTTLDEAHLCPRS